MCFKKIFQYYYSKWWWFDLIVSCPLFCKNNLNLRIKTEPVMAGVDASICCLTGMCTLHINQTYVYHCICSNCDGLGFYTQIPNSAGKAWPTWKMLHNNSVCHRTKIVMYVVKPRDTWLCHGRAGYNIYKWRQV